MNKFLRLKHALTQEPIAVSVFHIALVIPDRDNKRRTQLRLTGQEETYYIVDGTFKQVMEQIETALETE